VIDLRAARNDPEGFRAAVARKGAAEAFDALLAADERWRELVPRVDELRGRLKLKGKPTPAELEQLNQVKDELRTVEDELGAAEAERDRLLEQVPNPPDPSVPDGDTEDDAEELRRVGEPSPEGPEHTEIGRFEMERAARLSGSRFGYLVGDTALLALALYRFAVDRAVAHGHVPMLPPVLAREEAMYGTGFFPTERSNIYALPEDDLYLTGTSEVALAGLHMGEILDQLPLRYSAFSTCFRREAGAAGKDTRGMFRVHQFNKVELFAYTLPEDSWDEFERILGLEEADLYLPGTSEVALAGLHMGEILEGDDLPLRYAGLSTCFRREAGAAGKDTRGMFRVHQFNKVEMYVFTAPQDSHAEQERMIALEEALLQELGIPYRAVDVAAGDLGASATRKVDLEAWFPSQGRYREVTSCSNTTDFQARRLGIRVRSEGGLVPPHTLNGTVVTDRFVLAILENFQGAVPEPLQKYGAPSLIEA